MPILVVSASRISPTMITSGSARMKLRMAAAKVQPILAFICTWRSPACVISIGSSAVQILMSAVLRKPSTECSVVVLPEPVGPQTRNRPCGRDIICLMVSSAPLSKPSSSIGLGTAAASTRITTSSRPLAVGMVAMRSSTSSGPKRLKSILPSCGLRRSEMSSWLITLRREMTALLKRAGISR